jgi:glycosyltransferase involved in cell wall biosynthesis
MSVRTSKSAAAITVLRPSTTADLVSARVFDRYFRQNLWPSVAVQTVDIVAWLGAIFGPPGAPTSRSAQSAAFRAATQHFSFLCPDHHGIPLLPRLALLRNRSHSQVRLLLIAHSPAAYLLDWALLRPLLRDGDRIIAPTESARTTIALLCPVLDRFVRVIPHPIRSLGARGVRTARAVVLGRLVPEKLVHRVIDGIDILRKRGVAMSVDIAGPVSPPDSKDLLRYVRALHARVRRLGFGDQVRFLGLVEGEAAKADLFAGAAMLLNLSISLEESFGKSIAEALGCGVPAVVTRWDGLPETAGSPSASVEVSDEIFAMDISPEILADKMEMLLDSPPTAEACLAAARSFDPAKVAPRYRAVLEEAIEERGHNVSSSDDGPNSTEPAAPARGLLSVAAPLNVLSWRDLFHIHEDEFDWLRREMADRRPEELSAGGHIRTRLFLGQRTALQRFFAGLDAEVLYAPTGSTSGPLRTGTAILDVMERAAGTRATRSSRVVCLEMVLAEGRIASARSGLEQLRHEGLSSPGMDFLEVELLMREGQAAKALEVCMKPTAPSYWSEHASHRLQQLARIACDCGDPERALLRLREWTDLFPDSSNAGELWLARCALAARCGSVSDAEQSLAHARELLGDVRLKGLSHLLNNGREA